MPRADSPLAVRSLTAQDAAAFARLYATDPMRYLTIRLNLEVYGFESTMAPAAGAFIADDNEMRGVLLRYSNTAILADADGASAAVFAPWVDREEGLAGVRGSVEVVRRLRGALQRYRATGMELSTFLCLEEAPQCPNGTLQRARRAGPEDLELLTELYASAWSMYRSRANVAAKLAQTRVFVVEEEAQHRQPRRIVSSALLNIEASDAGLIGGVYTRPGSRGRGYAAACTAALSADLQRDSKLPCLFYENPVAGRVYRRLGFEERARWAVLYITL